MKKERIAYLDFAKGFAILSIVMFHYSEPFVEGIWSKVVMVGGTGVHLFFLISGFGLGLSSQRMSYFDFYKRRIAKILIPYYSFVVFLFIVNQFYPLYQSGDMYALGGHLFLYKMFDETIIGSFGYHFWFLSTIIQFYIIFPILLLIKRKTSPALFVTLSVAASMVYWTWTSYHHLEGNLIVNSFFVKYLWEFNIGMILADLYNNHRRPFWDQDLLTMSIVSLSGISAMGLMALKLGKTGQTFNDIPALIGFWSLSVTFFLVSEKIGILRGAVQYIGTISYDLYLTHLFVFALATLFYGQITRSGFNLWFSLLFVFPVSLAVAALFNRLQLKFLIRPASRFPQPHD